MRCLNAWWAVSQSMLEKVNNFVAKQGRRFGKFFQEARAISPPLSSLTDEFELCLVRKFGAIPCTTHGDAESLGEARLSAVSAVRQSGAIALAGETRWPERKSGVVGDEARRLVSL